MAYSNQILNSISVKKLKNVKNLDSLPLNEKRLTAILGVNGCGKSTILHALACCYKPPKGSSATNHLFSHWFTPTTDSTWVGSEFEISHSYKNGATDFDGIQQYTKQKDRWTPRYDKRPERHIELIGINTCVPKIEQESQISFIQYETNPLVNDSSDKVRAVAGEILGRNYTEFNQHKVSKTKNYIGLAHKGVRYSALSMGAGEQRLFHILTKVYEAPKYGLILIDEIDLLLHTNALLLLLGSISQRAEEKKLQIIFTTHRESVLELDEYISIKHIHQTDDKTHWLSDTKSDTLLRLTGKAEKTIELFVEDDIAAAIVMQVVASLGLRKYVSVKIFGASSNCFTVAASLVVKDEDFSNISLILDGDVYVTAENKKSMLEKVLSGNGAEVELQREKALSLIKQFNGEPNKSPEIFLMEMILSLDADELGEDEQEIHAAMKAQMYAADPHDLVKRANISLGFDAKEGNKEFVKLAAKSKTWSHYVSPVYEWLKERKHEHIENFN